MHPDPYVLESRIHLIEANLRNLQTLCDMPFDEFVADFQTFITDVYRIIQAVSGDRNAAPGDRP